MTPGSIFREPRSLPRLPGRARWPSAIDARTTRHAGYAVSLRKRKQIEEAFGWIKTIGGMRKTRFVGQARVAAQSLFTFAAYNLVRLGSLLGWRRAAPA